MLSLLIALTLTSSAFDDGGVIPDQYTCMGDNDPIPLEWKGAPKGTVAFSLIIDDPDAPKDPKNPDGEKEDYDHLVLGNISPKINSLEAALKDKKTLMGLNGRNGKGSLGYTGPCPPDKCHRYRIKLIAQKKRINPQKVQGAKGPTKKQVLEALKGNVLEETTLTGTYKKPGQDDCATEEE